MSMTTIEWTDRTWNPVRGCSRVSAGCDHCYAMGQAHRFSGPGKPYEGLTTIRRGKVDWAGRARLVPEMLDQPLKWKKPARIFVNSMSDLFHESLSNEEIAAVFGVMAACPQHTFQVLTKRPKRMAEWFKWVTEEFADLEGDVGERVPDTSSVEGSGCVLLAARILHPYVASSEPGFRESMLKEAPWPLPNVWLGVSVENQRTADERIPLLLATPAAVRFVSAEPLLDRIDLEGFLLDADDPEDTGQTWIDVLDWVIVGGESGHGARLCDVTWIRSIVEQCKAAGTACFVKQLGSLPAAQHPMGALGELVAVRCANRKGADMLEWPEDLRVRQMPGGGS
jgi:protein gp37